MCEGENILHRNLLNTLNSGVRRWKYGQEWWDFIDIDADYIDSAYRSSSFIDSWLKVGVHRFYWLWVWTKNRVCAKLHCFLTQRKKNLLIQSAWRQRYRTLTPQYRTCSVSNTKAFMEFRSCFACCCCSQPYNFTNQHCYLLFSTSRERRPFDYSWRRDVLLLKKQENSLDPPCASVLIYTRLFPVKTNKSCSWIHVRLK